MALSFRRRIQVASGVHINVSKSGMSTTVGKRGASITIGPNGTYVNTSIPGTGIYSRKKIGDGPLSHSGPSYPVTRGHDRQDGGQHLHRTEQDHQSHPGEIQGYSFQGQQGPSELHQPGDEPRHQGTVQARRHQ